MNQTDRNLTDDEKQMPFVEKFMVPQLYELFKLGGDIVKDDERDIRKMLQYFSDFFYGRAA